MKKNRVDEAMDVLDKMEKKFIDIQTKEGNEKVCIIKNHWDLLPETMGTPGVLICEISTSSDKTLKELVYIPKGGSVKPHFHEDLIETIIVVSGEIGYKLYETDQYSEVIAEGVLNEFEVLEIGNQRTHFIFTSKSEAYMCIDFKNVNCHEKN